MHRNVMILLFLVFTVIFLAAPAWAEDGQENYPVPQSVMFQQGEGGQVVYIDSNGSGTVGGIAPVSPLKLSAKLEQLGDKLYSIASPLADMIARLSLAGAALLLLLLLVVGAGILRRVVGACFCVALGLLLFYNAANIVAVLKYVAVHLGM